MKPFGGLRNALYHVYKKAGPTHPSHLYIVVRWEKELGRWECVGITDSLETRGKFDVGDRILSYSLTQILELTALTPTWYHHHVPLGGDV